MFESAARDLNAKDYARPDGQQKFEAAFEKRLADRKAEMIARQKERLPS
jgi:hypothetical protein